MDWKTLTLKEKWHRFLKYKWIDKILPKRCQHCGKKIDWYIAERRGLVPSCGCSREDVKENENGKRN